jgi:hypothetical protein
MPLCVGVAFAGAHTHGYEKASQFVKSAWFRMLELLTVRQIKVGEVLMGGLDDDDDDDDEC